MAGKLNAETARRIFRYIPETGRIYWRERPASDFKTAAHAKTWNTKWAGRSAFNSTNVQGYCQTNVGGRVYLAHRVAWLILTGDWPPDQIDHINGNRSDNRQSNIRAVSQSENSRNVRLRVRSQSGVTGVSWAKGERQWRARIVINGREHGLGYFKCIGAAACARAIANDKYQFSKRHGTTR